MLSNKLEEREENEAILERVQRRATTDDIPGLESVHTNPEFTIIVSDSRFDMGSSHSKPHLSIQLETTKPFQASRHTHRRSLYILSVGKAISMEYIMYLYDGC